MPPHLVTPLAQRVRWTATRAALRPLIRWKPIDAPRLGYSMIIGVTRPLAPLLNLQLQLIDAQNRSGLEDIILVFDTSLSKVRSTLEPLVERFAHLPLRLVGYNPIQAAVLHGIGWSKCFSWASWCLGLARVQSRHAMLHDFDAFLLDPEFLAHRHRLIRERDTQFLGVERYSHPPVLASDGLVGTWEMMFDAAWVRRNARPIDVFNQRSLLYDRTVDLDTFHALQARAVTDLVPVESGAIVHATQMICQSQQLLRSPDHTAPANMTTPLIPFLLEASGVSGSLEAADIVDQHATILGRRVRLLNLSADRVNGLRSMATAIDRTLRGGLRPEAEAYFDRLHQLASSLEPHRESVALAA
ncbi:MAG: hypothetical protein RLN76_00615 [Phycisphaeraceae bacterium]